MWIFKTLSLPMRHIRRLSITHVGKTCWSPGKFTNSTLSHEERNPVFGRKHNLQPISKCYISCTNRSHNGLEVTESIPECTDEQLQKLLEQIQSLETVIADHEINNMKPFQPIIDMLEKRLIQVENGTQEIEESNNITKRMIERMETHLRNKIDYSETILEQLSEICSMEGETLMIVRVLNITQLNHETHMKDAVLEQIAKLEVLQKDKEIYIQDMGTQNTRIKAECQDLKQALSECEETLTSFIARRKRDVTSLHYDIDEIATDVQDKKHCIHETVGKLKKLQHKCKGYLEE